jgi:hypothetical protein
MITMGPSDNKLVFIRESGVPLFSRLKLLAQPELGEVNGPN